MNEFYNFPDWKIITQINKRCQNTKFGPHLPPTLNSILLPTFFNFIYYFLGRAKDAWPELLNSNIHDAVSTLNNSGLVKNVYIQSPSVGTPPSNDVRGSNDDVWLYTDGNIVTEIPRRGEWHPNRNTYNSI